MTEPVQIATFFGCQVTVTKFSAEGVWAEGNMMRYGATSMQGYRSYMDDEYSVWRPRQGIPRIFFGVFDGCNGNEVARYAAERLPEKLFKNDNFVQALMLIEKDAGDPTELFSMAVKDAFFEIDSFFATPEGQQELGHLGDLTATDFARRQHHDSAVDIHGGSSHLPTKSQPESSHGSFRRFEKRGEEYHMNPDYRGTKDAAIQAEAAPLPPPVPERQKGKDDTGSVHRSSLKKPMSKSSSKKSILIKKLSKDSMKMVRIPSQKSLQISPTDDSGAYMFTPRSVQRGVFETAKKRHEWMRDIAPNEKGFRSGSTAACVVLVANYLIVANAGNSRVALCIPSKQELYETEDHTPRVDCEADRIKEADGVLEDNDNAVCFGDTLYYTTRSLGCHNLKRNPRLPEAMQIISAEPDVIVNKLRGDELIILATDGIWEAFSSHEIMEMIDNQRKQGIYRLDWICEHICMEAVRSELRDNEDNMAIILIDFGPDRFRPLENEPKSKPCCTLL